MCTKKLICKSYLKNECSRSNCKFAHSLDEQSLEGDRKNAFKKLSTKESLNYNEYQSLLQLTQCCPKCISNNCVGGKNCSYGAVDEFNLICKKDFFCGKCSEHADPVINNLYFDNEITLQKCTKGIHLTEMGLIPYNELNIHKKLMNVLNNTDDIELDEILELNL